jgi:hypothetical protein
LQQERANSSEEQLKRKEVNTMKYEKPQVVLLGSASVAVQHQVKAPSPFLDVMQDQTIGAYEADE